MLVSQPSRCSFAATFTGSDADAILHRQDEYLAVADVTRPGPFDDAFDGRFDKIVVDRNRKPYLLQQVDFPQGATPYVHVALLLATAQRIGDGYLEDFAGVQRLLDWIQPIRLNVRDDEFHGILLVMMVCNP